MIDKQVEINKEIFELIKDISEERNNIPSRNFSRLCYLIGYLQAKILNLQTKIRVLEKK